MQNINSSGVAMTKNIYFVMGVVRNISWGPGGKIIDESFGFLNSRTLYGKDFKQPICKENIIFKENRMNSHITYLYSLKTIDEVPLWKSQRKTFIIGFATSIKSIINISKDLLVNRGFKFVLTYKFSQDAIELFFGHMRGRFGSNNNPNCLQFTTAKKPFMDQEDEEESTIKLLIDNISNDPFINTITDKIIKKNLSQFCSFQMTLRH
ncbi:THAP-type domain-containing protein [Aphis craccivora]|uniref:THAP-type domain-containing protein n=1 Tax=Aphis craccivora TaxID=307492 RepID=A0A6G0VVH3_APHCR|nr:THAP-type domain-containing protein [Aphis craccivora]